MLVIGAKGHAKEILQILAEKDCLENLFFFDDVSLGTDKLYSFQIAKTISEVQRIFATDNRYILGIGNPSVRYNLNKVFENLGGELVSCVSKSSYIGKYDVDLGEGLNIMNEVFISNSVKIGIGSLLNHRCNIHHDCIVGDYCELSPGCQVLGNASIGNYCSIGAGAIILPKVKIGNNVVVGAGAVVNKDIPDNSLVVGVPAKVIKKLSPFNT